MKKLFTRVGLLAALGLAGPGAFAQAPTVDGTRDASYPAALAVQTVNTQFGDATGSTATQANGSELDNLHARIVGDKLYLFIGGNLETNYNKLDFFFDSRSGGQNQLTGNTQYVGAMNGLTFDAGFQADYALSLTCGSPAQAYADYAPIPTGNISGTFIGSSNGGLNPALNFEAVVAGASTGQAAIDDSNSAGVGGGTDAADPAAAAAVGTGIEVMIPLTALGTTAGGGDIKITVFINSGDHTYLSNQVLAGAPAGTSNLGTGAANFTALAGPQFVTVANGGAFTTPAPPIPVAPTPPTAALPAGANADGVTYLNNGTSAILTLTAPNKSYVYVVGDFNNWQATPAGLMSKTPTVNSDPATGRWWVRVDGLTPGQEYAYQFSVDGSLRVADPYGTKVLDPNNDQYIPAVTYPNPKAYPTGKTTGIVSVLQPGAPAYAWTATSFQRPARANLVVYELHLRDFIARHDYQTLTDTLQYLQRLGVNAIELLPVNEFEGNNSWGYNPSFYFAPDKYYGTPDAFKRFIDVCHSKGIAVIMDMVLNHSFGQSPMVQLYQDSGGPTPDNPWFNRVAKHPANVGYDFNHESPYTRYFAKNVMKYWLQNYHIDGYRFDLAKGFTQTNSGAAETQAGYDNWAKYDQSRINIWTDYYQTMVATDATLYPILELFADNSEEKVLANMGFMIWGNANYQYNQATMSYADGWDPSYGYYGSTALGGRGWNQPNLLTYMESHDEERLMFKNEQYGNGSGAYNIKEVATGLKRNEMAAALFFTQPGPRLVWQFGELGYDISINQNGRTGEKPILWNYYQDANRRHLYDTYQALIALRKQVAAITAPTSFTQNLAGPVKTISVANADLGRSGFRKFRRGSQHGHHHVSERGTWYNYLTGDKLVVTNPSTSLTLQPGQYGVYTSEKIKGLTKDKELTLASAALASTDALTTSFMLSVAPNPAAGTTTIYYKLPAAATANIAVQNLLGQTVRRVAPTPQPAGLQTQTVSLQGLAAGVYLIKLQAGEQTQTARLLVE